MFKVMMILFLSLQAQGALRITIDPGHGGENDRGATFKHIKESQLALKISQKLYEILKKDPLFQPQILRQSDHELSLENRVKMAEEFNSQIFLSIHINANPSDKAKGAEFYIQNQLPMNKESMQLAHYEELMSQNHNDKPLGDVESILFDLKKTDRILKSYQISTFMRKNWSPQKNKMIRQGPFYVLSQNQMPAVLVEVGYLTHSEERNKLLQPGEQERIAHKIHHSLKDYAKNMDKLPSGVLKPEHAQTR